MNDREIVTIQFTREVIYNLVELFEANEVLDIDGNRVRLSLTNEGDLLFKKDLIDER